MIKAGKHAECGLHLYSRTFCFDFLQKISFKTISHLEKNRMTIVLLDIGQIVTTDLRSKSRAGNTL